MFNTARPTSIAPTASSRIAPSNQRKHYTDGSSFHGLRAPAMPSLPYATAVSLEPGYRADDHRSLDWHSSRRETNGSTAAVDDRARTPRYFLDRDRGLDNRKAMTDYAIFARLQGDNFDHELPSSGFYFPTQFDDLATTNITPASTYSLGISDDTSLSMPESPEMGSDLSDYERPTTPLDSRNQQIHPPPSKSMQYTAYSRSRPDVGYNGSYVAMPEPDRFRSGSDGIPAITWGEPTFHHSGPGSVSSLAAGESPYAESVLSIESEDSIHRLARINSQYNAAASALYGALQRDSATWQERPSVPSTVPSVQRLPTPTIPTTSRASDSRQVYTDGALSSSPTQISYPDHSNSSTMSHDNHLPPQRPSEDNIINFSTPIYIFSSHTSSTSQTPNRHQDDFLPPRKDLESSKVPITPGNSPQSQHSLPNNTPPYYLTGRESERRPLPVPPSLNRHYSTRDDAPPREPIILHYARDPEDQSAPLYIRQPSTSVRDRGVSAQPTATQSLNDKERPTISVNVNRTSDRTGSPPSSHGPRFVAKSESPPMTDRPTRTPSTATSPSSTYGPRYIAKAESPPISEAPKSTSRHESASRYSREEERSARTDRSSRDNADRNDRRGGRRSEKHNDYDSSREDRTTEKSKPRSGRDHEHQTSTSQRQERPPHSSAPGPTGSDNLHETGRRRKDSLQLQHVADMRRGAAFSSPPEVILPPNLVPIVRQSPPRPEELARSHSRGGQLTTTSSQENPKRSARRYSDDDHGRDRSASVPGPPRPAAPEPHRRFSDGDVPQPAPPFFNSDASGKGFPQMSGRAASAARTVRWNDNLICPSPSSAPARRGGWFNRRGDQLWRNDGLYMPAPAGQEYPPDLDDYPDYGDGWMNEKGIRIDMSHRLVPKTPLRPALKQTQPR